MRSEAKVLDSLSSILGPSKEEGVASGGGSQGQLIQSQNFPSCSKDACTSRCGESKGSDTELGDSQESVVISDCADNDNGLVVRLFGGVRNDSGDRDRRAVDAGHKESAENDLVEG